MVALINGKLASQTPVEDETPPAHVTRVLLHRLVEAYVAQVANPDPKALAEAEQRYLAAAMMQQSTDPAVTPPHSST